MSQLSTTLRIKIWKQRKMQNKISRKEMLKKCGIGALSLGILSFLKPTEALAGIEDNSSAVSSTVYVGNTQPLTSSEYLGWLNTTDGLWYYRTDTSSSVWNVASSAWT